MTAAGRAGRPCSRPGWCPHQTPPVVEALIVMPTDAPSKQDARLWIASIRLTPAVWPGPLRSQRQALAVAVLRRKGQPRPRLTRPNASTVAESSATYGTRAADQAYQRLYALEVSGALHQVPTTSFPSELPCLLAQAFDLAASNGLTLAALANELAWHTNRVRILLSQPDNRPQLRVVT